MFPGGLSREADDRFLGSKTRLATLVSPDCRPSSSKLVMHEAGTELVWVMVVRGLGALTLRATGDPESGRLEFQGVALFTKADIGYCPDLDGGF